ncbi:hypothetical protein CK203_055346 [Vitis vinifera]|uniref:Transmembrane protein n=1 Tax=Vitis vinifera TaxID=29760 RepID=A0A438GSY9_VITVI|nr:hypothetical protein CK203_055346 [Vitis vinifera]
MLGRVRPLSSSSSSSLDSLERPSPKIIKHDSLSIYGILLLFLVFYSVILFASSLSPSTGRVDLVGDLVVLLKFIHNFRIGA